LAADGADAKRRLRSTLGARRSRVSPREAAAAASALVDAVLEEPRIRRARRVALYAASDHELPTRSLFEALGSLSIARLLPRFDGAVISWGGAEDWDALTAGRFGILEPPSDPAVAGLTANDVVLLPGVAFDRSGWRLGRGGGHYDRSFPPGTESPWLVGVGYSFQWLAELPHDSRDRRVDAIVTENGWVWRARGTT
jgi:5-formyltetrahydrofolate cyclo-ligase